MKVEAELEQRPIRPSPSKTGWEVLGVLLTTSGLVLTGFYSTHSFAHECGIVAFAVGVVLKLYRTHYLLASLVICVGMILGLLFGFRRIPCAMVLSLIVLSLIYGWWRERQAKTVAKR